MFEKTEEATEVSTPNHVGPFLRFLGGLKRLEPWTDLIHLRYGPYKILVFGLIGAGKSTVLKNLDLGDVTTITHAGGQMSEMLKYSIYKFITWDLEGPELKMEELPKNFLKKTDGVIFVVDKSSDEHVKNARKALHTLMNQKEMQNTVLLVFLGFTNDFVVISFFKMRIHQHCQV